MMRKLTPLLSLLVACSDHGMYGHFDAQDTGGADDATASACADEPAGATRCANDGRLESCLLGRWVASACPGGTLCAEGACLSLACEPGEVRCATTRVREVCNAQGTGFDSEPCELTVCQDGACVAGCVPGTRRCDGMVVLECGDDLTEAPVETCDGAAGELCAGGRCLTECEVRGAKRGNLACDFWAADLPNDETAMDNVFAFAFSNASPREAMVTVTFPWGPVETVPIAAHALATLPLPVPRVLSQIVRAGIGRYGFRIQSDQPIAAFMFNPLERYDETANASVATNDASLLIPATALGTRYLALTYTDPGENSRPPYVTVVATEDDTRIVVTSREVIQMQQSPYVVIPGEPTAFTLAAYETLNLEPPGTQGEHTDMSGTRVESLNHPIAVFSGNRCARVPDEGRFCDHLETQLPPLETWGQEHVVTKFTDRGGESDYFRVIAQKDGTELTFDPPRAAPTLAAGELWQFASREGFLVTSTHPILLGQFMASQSMTTPPGPFGISADCPPEFEGTCQGDPSMVLAAPVEQWRSELIFLVPDTYRHQFINVAFTAGTTMTLDGADVDTSQALTLGSGAWRSLTLPTSGGHRTLIASSPVGVIVYGYDHNISYAFNAGLDFKVLRSGP